MKLVKSFFSNNINETKKIAEWVVDNLIKDKDRCIIFLKGDLGSGKTTFTRFALESLGINEDQFNGSPTFTIVNEYFNRIYHIDLYRFDDGIDDFIYEYFYNNSGVFFVEWPEKLVDINPDIVIEFFSEDDGRKINVYSS